jgi:2-oxoisovalerate dehydrogenase E1 component
MDNLFALAKKSKDHFDNIDPSLIEEGLRIRLVEDAFLELFSLGKMNGTVHTCVGQELSAVAVCHFLTEDDWVTSNHRCHGHFISKTGNWKGLVDELMGLKSGVCGGIGSSQHLYAEGFLSNGIQGSLMPVGTGIALHKKLAKKKDIVVSFLGEGTLGEGILYEAFNLASLHSVPQLFVCENNFYSQSTPQVNSVAGSIVDRAKSFGIKAFECNTWESIDLFNVVRDAIDYVRKGQPAFVNIQTYRLNAHSKGDDNRNGKEIDYFKSHDPLNLALEKEIWRNKKNEIEQEIRAHIKVATQEKTQKLDYCHDQLPRLKEGLLLPIENDKIRMVQALNKAYSESLVNGAFLIGEDIVDPYGGAFKVTKGFSDKYPNQVFASSISEGGMVGVSIGMALMGTQSFTEIMFGDFMTLAFDQLVNNASKMHHMYNFQVDVPLRVRTPMGGKRGYGPTHSQSLEKFLVGIDNVLTIALSSLHDPGISIAELDKFMCPAVVIENKLDYGRVLWQGNDLYKSYREDKPFGGLILSPNGYDPTITIVSYGDAARHVADNLAMFFEETDEFAELVCLTQLHPMDLSLVKKSVDKTKRLLVIEDGSVNFGIGSEVLAKLIEEGIHLDFAKRIGSEPYPIPSVNELELQILPTIDSIVAEVLVLKTGALS